MANKKITDLPAVTGQVRKTNLIEVVQDVSGTPISRKIAPEAFIPNQIDIPPATANALDDEFDNAATLPGGGSAIWSWDNQGTGTAAVSNGSLQLTALAAAGNNMKSIIQTAPATPWEFTALVYRASRGGNFTNAGLIAMESSTGKRMIIGLNFNSGEIVQVDKYTNANTFGVTAATESGARIGKAYLRVVDNGTNLIWYYSQDGIAWIQLYSEARTAYMAGGPNRIGLATESNSAAFTVINSCAWFRRTV